MQILRKELGEAREWRRGEGKKGGNCRHKAQVKPGYEWGTFTDVKYLCMRCREEIFFVHLIWSHYKFKIQITVIKHVTISAQRRRSEIGFNEPRQPSWSIFDACADTPPAPTMLHSSCQSTNFLRGPPSPLRFELFICKAVKIWVIKRSEKWSRMRNWWLPCCCCCCLVLS